MEGKYLCVVAQGRRDKKLPDKHKISTRYHKEVGYSGHAHQKALLESEHIFWLRDMKTLDIRIKLRKWEKKEDKPSLVFFQGVLKPGHLGLDCQAHRGL